MSSAIVEIDYSIGCSVKLTAVETNVGVEDLKPSYTAIKIAYSKGCTVNLDAVGIEAGVEALKSSNLTIESLKISDCATALSLEDCWNSDVKNINITNQSSAFKLANLSVAMMRAYNQNL